jgi:hypothetical protein
MWFGKIVLLAIKKYITGRGDNRKHEKDNIHNHCSGIVVCISAALCTNLDIGKEIDLEYIKFILCKNSHWFKQFHPFRMD